MRFCYQYRTSDNVLHDGVVSASDREEAFGLLKARGIKPGKLFEAPGFFNKLFGKGKRWLAIGALAVIAAVSLATVHLQNRIIVRAKELQPSVRHQIYGDPTILGAWHRSDYAEVFPLEGDRVLARYARPGLSVAPLDPRLREETVAQLEKAVATGVVSNEEDLREVRELKAIVLGMKKELAEYLAAGEKTESYILQLEARQRREYQIVENVRKDLSGTTDDGLWAEKNAALRAMGLPTIPHPDD